MKKFFYISLILTTFLCTIVAAISPSRSYNDVNTSETKDNPSEQDSNITTNLVGDPGVKTYTQTAYILDIDLENNTIMIGASMDTDYESQTRVFIKEDTDILIDLATSSIEKLSIGNPILITYTGGIAESAPAQMHWPIQIEVIE